jgi:hypothetical protein
MTYPEVGVGLPIVGAQANPQSIAELASAVDQLGFAAVAVFERLLLRRHPTG